MVDVKAKTSEEDAKVKAHWEKVDAELCSLLRLSIDSKLMPLFCPFQTCYTVWEKARALCTNDISRFYDVISRLTNLMKQEFDVYLLGTGTGSHGGMRHVDASNYGCGKTTRT